MALIRRKAKESACQACSAKPRRGSSGEKGEDTGGNKGRRRETEREYGIDTQGEEGGGETGCEQ